MKVKHFFHNKKTSWSHRQRRQLIDERKKKKNDVGKFSPPLLESLHQNDAPLFGGVRPQQVCQNREKKVRRQGARASMSFVRPLLSSLAEIIQVRPGQDLPLEGNRASTAGPKVSRESRNWGYVMWCEAICACLLLLLGGLMATTDATTIGND